MSQYRHLIFSGWERYCFFEKKIRLYLNLLLNTVGRDLLLLTNKIEISQHASV